MAFTQTNLAKVAGANGWTLWYYTTTDTLADVNTSGYFNDASQMLRVNDLIIASVDTDGTVGMALLPVVSNSSGVVDVSDGTSISMTDSD